MTMIMDMSVFLIIGNKEGTRKDLSYISKLGSQSPWMERRSSTGKIQSLRIKAVASGPVGPVLAGPLFRGRER